MKKSTFLVDTHTHIYLPKFDKDRKEMIQRAFDNQVEHFFLPNIDRASIPQMLDLVEQYPQNCHPMMGLHPCSVGKNYKKDLLLIEKWLEKRDFCAIGEIGLDYYWDTSHVAEQKEAFRIQCQWAKNLDLPIVIHARDSLDDLIELVRLEKTSNFRGVFHCFGGSLEQAQKIMDLGFYMGIGGVLTFKKAGLDKVIKDIPMEYLVLETDAPYLSPVPFRGKRNESGYIRHIAENLAQAKDISMGLVAEVSTKNAFNLFNKVTVDLS